MSTVIQRMVYIENFGPISNAEINLNKSFQIYIGAQASGKSTLCKVCYFCRKIRDYTLAFLLKRSQFEKKYKGNEGFSIYNAFLINKLIGCFGTTVKMQNFTIRYKFGGHQITIQSREGSVNFIFDRNLKRSIFNLIKKAGEIYMNELPQEVLEIFGLTKFATIVRESFVHNLHTIFMDRQEIIYVPAGRSLLATIPEKVWAMPMDIIDLTMKEFIHKISDIKDQFSVKLPEMKEYYKKIKKEKINYIAVVRAYKLVKNIMKADYINETDEEKIYFDEKHWVRLVNSSSGQQESLWILLLCYLYILEKNSVFMIIEEPEAHLFPDAQKSIVKLISLLTNTTNSNVILTTHSPYILTSTNILLLADDIRNKRGARADFIVPRDYQLPWFSFYASYIESGKLCSIMDEEEKMIDIEYIDRISGVTNNEMDSLLELENND